MIDPVKVYKFGEFTLNPAKRILFREASEIKLRDKDFDILLFLLAHAPKTCSHDEIIDTVWSGTNVENNSIEKAIANIRSVLGDNAKAPRFIKTVRAKGYLFVSDMWEAEEKPSNGSGLNGNNIHLNKSQRSLQSRAKVLRPRNVILFSIIILVVGIGWLFWWKGGDVWARYSSTVIFADNFSGNEIDTDRWKIFGKSVKVADDSLKLSVDETDNPGEVYSRFFIIDPAKRITIVSRLKISYSRNMKDETYFGGVFGFIQKSDGLDNLPAHQDTDTENHRFTGVRYMNYYSRLTFAGYSGETLQEVPTEGFFLVKDGGRPSAKEEYQAGKISERIDPVWDKWFEQKIEYDPVSGEMIYFVDGERKGLFNVGSLNAKDNQIRLQIMPWGWWVNHSIEVDYINVSQ